MERTKKAEIIRKRRRKRLIANAIFLLAVIFVSIIIGVVIWALGIKRQVENPDWNVHTKEPVVEDTNTPTDPGHTMDVPIGTPTQKPDDDVVWGRDILNILLIGYDEEESRGDTYSVFRTDTLILVSVYLNENRVLMTSVPRDTYVLIGEDFKRKDKINSVPYYAMVQKVDTYDAIRSTVSRLFGNIPIDYYFAINMDVFVEVIDTLGGIEYDVDVEVKYNDIVLIEKGMQVLDGKNALMYVRFRGTATADIGRVERQQKFIKSAFQQLKSLDKIMKLPSVYSTFMNKIDTNLTMPQMLNLASFAANSMGSDAIESETLPGSFLTLNNISYWGIDKTRMLFYIYDKYKVTVKDDVWD